MEIILGISFILIAIFILFKAFSGMIRSVTEILVEVIKEARK